jgi:hypothetical protein
MTSVFRLHIISGSVIIKKLPKPMCLLCKNNDSRTYSHSRTPHHKKLLLALFRQKQIEYKKKYPFLL